MENNLRHLLIVDYHWYEFGKFKISTVDDRLRLSMGSSKMGLWTLFDDILRSATIIDIIVDILSTLVDDRRRFWKI